VQTETKDGVTLYRFYDDFPDITNSFQAFLPLRYLTTNKEFEAMQKNENKKMVVDEFWLKTGGNPARAKLLISKFYNNVRKANIYFTSYIEGWKTDRGIIYSVYGPPNIVYKNGNNETWTYGEKGNLLSIKFSFTKVSNPFSNNDYALNKAPVYKDNWYMTVESWRR
jgi:GWxTD domain-containing protein